MDEKDRKSHEKYVSEMLSRCAGRVQFVRETLEDSCSGPEEDQVGPPEKETVEEADEESSGQSRPPKEETVKEVMEISVLQRNKKGRRSRFIIPTKRLAPGSSFKEEAEEEDEEQEGKKADEGGIASKMVPRPPASRPPGYLLLKRKADKQDEQNKQDERDEQAEQVSKKSRSTWTPGWKSESSTARPWTGRVISARPWTEPRVISARTGYPKYRGIIVLPEVRPS